jgi:hypothetical protein
VCCKTRDCYLRSGDERFKLQVGDMYFFKLLLERARKTTQDPSDRIIMVHAIMCRSEVEDEATNSSG